MEQEKLLQEYTHNIYEEPNQGENNPENNDSNKNNSNGVKKSIITAIVVIIAIIGVTYFINRDKSELDKTKDETLEELSKKDENLSQQEQQEKKRQNDLADLAILGSEGKTFNIYFSKTGDVSCGDVYPVERRISEGQEMISGSLFNLFSGPTEEEKEQGYTSIFSNNTLYILKWVKVTGGTAYLNLKDIRNIIPNASSSCGNEQFESQIINTIGQFVDINKLVIAIEGNPETYYEWNQIGCQDNLCDKAPFGQGLSFGSEE